jgi:hypothetical protein
MAKKIDGAVTAGDAKKLRKVLGDASASVATDLAKLMQKFNAEVDPDYRIDSTTKIPDELRAAFRNLDQENGFIAEASGYKRVYTGKDDLAIDVATMRDGMHSAIGILLDAVNTDKATIEARQLSTLDKCIADIQAQERLNALHQGPPAAITAPGDDVDPAHLCRDARNSADLMATKSRLLRLSRFFEARNRLEIELSGLSGKRMKAATDEIAAIDAQISASQAALVPATVTKVDDPVQARVIVYPALGGATPSDDLAKTVLTDASIATTHPQYVIVLQPAAFQPPDPHKGAQ